MMHTDQGFQYQHSSWRNLIHDNGGVQSMSRKANCYDNAVMENFFGHLKTEMYHGEVFDSIEEFNQAIDGKGVSMVMGTSRSVATITAKQVGLLGQSQFT